MRDSWSALSSETKCEPRGIVKAGRVSIYLLSPERWVHIGDGEYESTYLKVGLVIVIASGIIAFKKSNWVRSDMSSMVLMNSSSGGSCTLSSNLSSTLNPSGGFGALRLEVLESSLSIWFAKAFVLDYLLARNENIGKSIVRRQDIWWTRNG